jgi:hypothetical protein
MCHPAGLNTKRQIQLSVRLLQGSMGGYVPVAVVQRVCKYVGDQVGNQPITVTLTCPPLKAQSGVCEEE